MLNHSCVPNAFVQFAGRKALLRAYQAIKEGEEVEISYIGKVAPTLQFAHNQGSIANDSL